MIRKWANCCSAVIGSLTNIIMMTGVKMPLLMAGSIQEMSLPLMKRGILVLLTGPKLVKSGAEWISSVDLENALMAHEAVFEASVIGIPDAEWQERPIACVVLHDAIDDSLKKEDLFDFLRPQFAKFWIPDDILFLDEIPKTSVGKFLKRELREQVKQHYHLQG